MILLEILNLKNKPYINFTKNGVSAHCRKIGKQKYIKKEMKMAQLILHRYYW